MPKWKLQWVEPDTCEPPGCRYLELWDVFAPAESRTHAIAAFDRVCPAHDIDVPLGVMLWADGNWKPLGEYLDYQRAWFKHLNHQEWLAKRAEWDAAAAADPRIAGDALALAWRRNQNPYRDMPPAIAPYEREPPTTGSMTPPGQDKRANMAKVYGWNREHNARKNEAVRALQAEGGAVTSWAFEGHGDGRVLRVRASGTQAARGRASAGLDIQFGPGRIVIEG